MKNKSNKTTSKKKTENQYLVEIDPDKLMSERTANHLKQIEAAGKEDVN